MLILAATPLGNLKDISQRTLDELASCDAVLCEDTRRTLSLLSHFGLSKKIFRYNDHVPATMENAMAMLRRGLKVCLVTDAGMPCISDPGWKLVRAAIVENIRVEVLPGPSSAICALAGSGFPIDNFTFLGFLPRGRSKLFKKLKNSLSGGYPVVFYESPFRLKSFLQEASAELPSCRFVVARELTKAFEEWFRGTAAEILALVSDREIKGEITIVAWEDMKKERDADEDKVKKVLYVCNGNTCRSVMAQHYSAKIFPPEISLSSAGLCAPSEIEVPQEVFYALSTEGIEKFEHSPKQLSKKDIEEADIVLCMTERQLESLKGFFPEYSDRIFQLSAFAGLGRADIADPWGHDRDFYLITFKTIKNCVKGVLEKIIIKNI